MTPFPFKSCKGCAQSLPLEAFYKHKTGGQGRYHICKECHKSAVRIRARTNPSVQERERRRAKLPHRRALSAAIARRWRERHPDAYRAQTAVGNALRDGKIQREPCVICGSPNWIREMITMLTTFATTAIVIAALIGGAIEIRNATGGGN